MTLRSGRNTGLGKGGPPSGMSMVETSIVQELDCLDSLPAIVRQAIRDAAFSMSAEQTLTAHLMGWRPEEIVARIAEADQDLARLNGTCPEAYVPGQSNRLAARPGSRQRRRVR